MSLQYSRSQICFPRLRKTVAPALTRATSKYSVQVSGFSDLAVIFMEAPLTQVTFLFDSSRSRTHHTNTNVSISILSVILCNFDTCILAQRIHTLAQRIHQAGIFVDFAASMNSRILLASFWPSVSTPLLVSTISG